MGQEEFETLLSFFKALSNESRLKIIGILANGERTVGELAAMLYLKEPTVSQHLDMLKWVGLVNVRAEGNHRVYSFDSRALNGMTKEVFSREHLASLIPNFEEVGDAWERKVFKAFFDGERLIQLPASEKKLLVIIKWLADKFAYGVRYTEKQVNDILTRYYADYATLRRELIDCGYMQREKGIYWRVPAVSSTAQTADQAE
jgi:DNA-binding transcriptional ArsR family regulator